MVGAKRMSAHGKHNPISCSDDEIYPVKVGTRSYNMKRALYFTLSMFMICMSLPEASQATELGTLAEKVRAVYSEEIASGYGIKLEIKLDSENPRYFGGANLEGGKYTITVGEDLLKLPEMTADAATLILCHELGHLLGGSPKKTSNPWASTESQSDYFAAAVCAPKLFEKETYTLNQERELDLSKVRERIVKAGDSLVAAIYDYMDVPQMKRPSLNYEEKPSHPGSLTNYPTLQCRLDTFKAGANLLPLPPCW